MATLLVVTELLGFTLRALDASNRSVTGFLGVRLVFLSFPLLDGDITVTFRGGGSSSGSCNGGGVSELGYAFLFGQQLVVALFRVYPVGKYYVRD